MLSLRGKLLLSHLLLVLLGLVVTGALGYHYAAQALERTRLVEFEALAGLQVEKLGLVLDAIAGEIDLARDYYNIRHNLAAVTRHAAHPEGADYLRARRMLDSQLAAYAEQERYRDFMLVDAAGRLVYTTDAGRRRTLLGRPIPAAWRPLLERARRGFALADVVTSSRERHELCWLAGGPVRDLRQATGGVILLQLAPQEIIRSLHGRTGLGQSGETALARRLDRQMLFLHELRHDRSVRLRTAPLGGPAAQPMQRALGGASGSGVLLDYRGRPVLAAWRPVPRLGWGLVVKIDEAEAREPARTLLRRLLAAGAVGLLVALALAVWLSRAIVGPLRRMARTAERIAGGDLSVRADTTGRDELAALGASFNRMADGLIISNNQLQAQNEALNRVALVVETDGAGRITSVNQRFAELSGYPAEQLVGRTHSLVSSGRHPAFFWKRLWEAVSAGRVWRDEICNRRADGELFWVDTSIAPVLDGDGRPQRFIAISIDATQRRAAAEQIAALNRQVQRWAERRELQLRAVLENVPEAVIVCDPEGRIRSANAAVERLFGHPPARLAGARIQPLLELEPEAALPADGFHPGRGVRADGATFDLELTISPVGSAERPERIVIARDVTERRQMARRLAEQEHLAHLGRMAAMVAHEVKNPLAGIKGAIEVIGRRLPPDSPERAVIPEILERIDGLDDMVRDLLLFARPRAPRLARVPLRRLLEDSIAHLRRDPQLAGIEIGLDGGTACVAPLDADLFRPVLDNLLLNAAQAMSGRGRVAVRIECDGGRCRVALADEGPGIAPDVRERIFEPFVTTKARGSGLGLAVARRVVEAHGGRIWIESPPGGGTTVWLDLPGEALP